MGIELRETYDVLTADVIMREGLNKTRYHGFVSLAHHIWTLNIFHRAMCSETKVDNTMHKQIIICFLMRNFSVKVIRKA